MRSFMHRAHDDRKRARDAFDLHLQPYRRYGTTAAFTRQIDALDPADTLAIQDRLTKLQVPTRIVWGAADRFQKVRYARRFAEDLDAPMDPIKGGHHFTPEDHPRRVAAAINDLVRTVRATSPSSVQHSVR